MHTSSAISPSLGRLASTAILALVSLGCWNSQRSYEMTWTATPTIHEKFKGAEDIHLTFVEDPCRTYVVVSGDLGPHLRQEGRPIVTAVWNVERLLGFVDTPSDPVSIAGRSGWDAKWSCWLVCP